jgi:hypothetical protein
MAATSAPGRINYLTPIFSGKIKRRCLSKAQGVRGSYMLFATPMRPRIDIWEKCAGKGKDAGCDTRSLYDSSIGKVTYKNKIPIRMVLTLAAVYYMYHR